MSSDFKKYILKQLTIFISVLLVFFLSLGIFIYFYQVKILFHSIKDDESYKEILKDDSIEEINFEYKYGKLNGWITKSVKKRPLIIFYGGNQQLSSRTYLSFKKNNRFKYFEGYNFMYIDYPSYGKSTGKLKQKVLFEAVTSIYDYASKYEFVDSNHINIIGYSIGSGLASYTASNKKIDRLILVAPYDNINNLFNDKLNIFHGPLKSLIRFNIKSDEYAKNINAKALIITSKSDEVINYRLSKNLYDCFNNDKEIKVFEKLKHNDYFSNEDVLILINNFLNT